MIKTGRLVDIVSFFLKVVETVEDETEIVVVILVDIVFFFLKVVEIVGDETDEVVEAVEVETVLIVVVWDVTEKIEEYDYDYDLEMCFVLILLAEQI